MKNAMNIAGVAAGVVLVVVSLPSTGAGLAGMIAGLALAGVNIYALLARRKAARLAGQKGTGNED